MSLKLLTLLALVVAPSVAAASGNGSDRDRVNREIAAMQADGRWEQLMAEGRANREAFEALRGAQHRTTTYTATQDARPRRRN